MCFRENEQKKKLRIKRRERERESRSGMDGANDGIRRKDQEDRVVQVSVVILMGEKIESRCRREAGAK